MGRPSTGWRRSATNNIRPADHPPAVLRRLAERHVGRDARPGAGWEEAALRAAPWQSPREAESLFDELCEQGWRTLGRRGRDTLPLKRSEEAAERDGPTPLHFDDLGDMMGDGLPPPYQPSTLGV
jgi:hypothetical protein